MTYIIQQHPENVPFRSLKYPARDETTKFIHPILWEMTFFAPGP